MEKLLLDVVDVLKKQPLWKYAIGGALGSYFFVKLYRKIRVLGPTVDLKEEECSDKTIIVTGTQ